LTGVVASLDGLTVLRSRASGEPLEAARLGTVVAEELLAKGAKALLDASRG
jgi:porphobilinogen deaminase